MTKTATNPWILSSIGFALLYFQFPHFIVKALPIWCLALSIFLRNKNTSHATAIAVGLSLSSVGDILLAFEDEYKSGGYFVPGLVAFLLAHIAYIVGMSQPVQNSTLYFSPFVAVYYIFVMSRLIPSAEADLRIPVLVYGVAICSMGFMAINRVFASKETPQSNALGLLASIIFVVSDSILAFNKFYVPIPDAHFYVMITYYTAQNLFAASVHSVTQGKEKR